MFIFSLLCELVYTNDLLVHLLNRDLVWEGELANRYRLFLPQSLFQHNTGRHCCSAVAICRLWNAPTLTMLERESAFGNFCRNSAFFYNFVYSEHNQTSSHGKNNPAFFYNCFDSAHNNKVLYSPGGVGQYESMFIDYEHALYERMGNCLYSCWKNILSVLGPMSQDVGSIVCDYLVGKNWTRYNLTSLNSCDFEVFFQGTIQ